MTVSQAEAIRTFPELAGLAGLSRTEWRFRPVYESGELVCIVGWRKAGAAIDVLWIYGRADCRAARVLVGSLGGMVWDHCGDLASCVTELLVLPAPDVPTAPRLVKARAPSLWTP